MKNRIAPKNASIFSMVRRALGGNIARASNQVSAFGPAAAADRGVARLAVDAAQPRVLFGEGKKGMRSTSDC